MKINDIISSSKQHLNGVFDKMESIALENQRKVLSAFTKNRVAVGHFSGTSGYGYSDTGRETLCKVFADVFGAEDALVSPNFASGTHAITTMLFGILRPRDTIISLTGKVYDTLNDVFSGSDIGSLAEFEIKFKEMELKNNDFDYEKINELLCNTMPKAVYIQRSRGYEWREALSIEQIAKVTALVKGIQPQTLVLVDNCYGEFVDLREPTEVGCDLVAGSLIKNPGGGIAYCGGYIAGRKAAVELCWRRLTAPSLGSEVGSYAHGYRELFQGLFLAPHTVLQALKTAALFCNVFATLGYKVLPAVGTRFNDIICSIELSSRCKLIDFCRAVQQMSPIDSFAVPEPWDMPGYADKVIMASGSFVSGSSIEISCDAPLRPPYIVYVQGALTFEHGILVLENILSKLNT